MAVEQPGFSCGFMEAAVSLAAAQFYCVKPSADAKINLTTVAGEAFLGVLQDKPIAGSPGNVMLDGITKIMVGTGGLTYGQKWMCATDGTAIPWTTGNVAGGICLIGNTVGKLATVTIGTQIGAAGYINTYGVTAPAASKIINGGSHTTTAGEASANTMSIAHGLTTPASWIVQVVDAGNNVVTADADVTLSGANLVIADGSTYNTVEGQIVRWIAFGV